MQKDTWIIIGVMVALVGLLATFMVFSLNSIESRLTAMDNRLAAMDNRLAAMDGRLHEMNTRLSRIEGHLALPGDIEPIQFDMIVWGSIPKDVAAGFFATGLRRGWRPRRGRVAGGRHLDAPGIPASPCPSYRAGTSRWRSKGAAR